MSTKDCNHSFLLIMRRSLPSQDSSGRREPRMTPTREDYLSREEQRSARGAESGRNYPLREYPPRDHPPRDYPPRERDDPPRDAPLPPRDYLPRDYPPRDYPPRDYPPRDYPPRDYPPPTRDYPPRDYPPPTRGHPPPTRDYPPPTRDYPPPPPTKDYPPRDHPPSSRDHERSRRPRSRDGSRERYRESYAARDAPAREYSSAREYGSGGRPDDDFGRDFRDVPPRDYPHVRGGPPPPPSRDISTGFDGSMPSSRDYPGIRDGPPRHGSSPTEDFRRDSTTRDIPTGAPPRDYPRRDHLPTRETSRDSRPLHRDEHYTTSRPRHVEDFPFSKEYSSGADDRSGRDYPKDGASVREGFAKETPSRGTDLAYSRDTASRDYQRDTTSWTGGDAKMEEPEDSSRMEYHRDTPSNEVTSRDHFRDPRPPAFTSSSYRRSHPGSPPPPSVRNDRRPEYTGQRPVKLPIPEPIQHAWVGDKKKEVCRLRVLIPSLSSCPNSRKKCIVYMRRKSRLPCSFPMPDLNPNWPCEKLIAWIKWWASSTGNTRTWRCFFEERYISTFEEELRVGAE